MPAIAFQYPEELRAVLDGIASFIKAEIRPRHARNEALLGDGRQLYGEDGRYVAPVLALIREVRMASAEAGYYAMCAPESIGGQGLGSLAWFAAWELIYRECSEHQWLAQFIISRFAYGPSPMLAALTPEARERYLPGIMSGSQSMCFGMSEPDAGSDALRMRSRAVRDGDGWRLTGSKIWISNSPYAEYCIVFAVTDPEKSAARKGGISAFLVPTDAPGFHVDRVIRMWGHVGGIEATLKFEKVRIEPHQLIGPLDRGLQVGMLGANLGRLQNTAKAVGLGRWAIEQALAYTKIRKAFGSTLSDYQGLTFPLAESAMQMHAAHLMGLNAAQLVDAGLPARKELSMTKAFSTQMSAMAIDRAIQVHGAIGLTNELGLVDAWKSMRESNISDGTNEILRRTIVKEMLDGDIDL